MSYRILNRTAALAAAALLLAAACTRDETKPPSGGAAAPSTRPAPPAAPAGGGPELGTAPRITPPSDIRPTGSGGVEYLDPVPMSRLINVAPGSVDPAREVQVPLITWGGDVATILANGGRTTQPGSIFHSKGLSLRLFREDNFQRAVEKVVAGETPYLRGTMDMVASALEALKDRGIDMVAVYQLTWSTGGDTIVVRSDQVASPADLKGKSIGIQRAGPHMLYLSTVLKDAGLSLGDVQVRWLRELTAPPYDTGGVAVDPMTAMQRDPSLSAVTVISPDMMALTSGGTVGTGAESSVKGAKLLLSTKTAGAVIADVYAVRRDYLDARRDEVQQLVHGLLLAQEELEAILKNPQARQADFQNLLRLSADLLRDSPQATADVEGLLADATFAGYPGNVQFFTGEGTRRNFEVLTREAHEALLGYRLLTGPVALAQARWPYEQLAQGLRNTGGVVAPRFDPASVERVVRERESRGATKEGVLFEFEVAFEPNQNDFAVDRYRREFDSVLGFASTYPGALIVVEGHSDPLRYQQLRAEGRPEAVLNQTKQAAKNLSLQRAIAVRESVVSLGRQQQLVLDTSQFTVVGSGIDRPRFPNPRNEQEWRANMRVAFQIIQVEAELQRFAAPGAGG